MENLDPAKTHTEHADSEEQEQLGLDDESTDEIVLLIDGLQDDDVSKETVEQDDKGTTNAADAKDVDIPLNDDQTKEQDKEESPSRKSSELIRWKAEQISDLLESYISLREAQNWS